MSPRVYEIAEFVRAFQASHHGLPPSIREIGRAVGLSSSSTIHSHLITAQRHGLLLRYGNGPGGSVPRSYVAPPIPGQPCPLCGCATPDPVPRTETVA